MDISFQTAAGGNSWSLTECAEWAEANDFDCVRLADNATLNSEEILKTGPDQVNTILSNHHLLRWRGSPLLNWILLSGVKLWATCTFT